MGSQGCHKGFIEVICMLAQEGPRVCVCVQPVPKVSRMLPHNFTHQAGRTASWLDIFLSVSFHLRVSLPLHACFGIALTCG